jgi:deazaflavin-dependent oxidoreductase (nitroreductase family)
MESTHAAAVELPRSAPTARTLPAQGAVNWIIRGLLRTPLLCRVAGSRLITIHLVGRKSGKRYAIPVAYTRQHDRLVVGTPFGWGRNLRTGEPVRIRLKGKLRSADVEVISDEAGVVENYARMARDNHQFAKFNQIGFDDAGNPRLADLQAAWAHGSRVFRFTLNQTNR